MKTQAAATHVQDEVERFRTHLREYVETSGIGLGILAQRLDMSERAMSSLLARGGSPLEVHQIFAVLEALDLTPQRLFGDLYGERLAKAASPSS